MAKSSSSEKRNKKPREIPLNISSEIPFKRTEKLIDKIEKNYASEAVFALCGPIGSPIHEVGERLRTILIEKYGYEHCEIIRIGKVIPQLGIHFNVHNKLNANSNDKHDDINKKIEIGNKLRKEFGNSILAEFAIDEIVKIKASNTSGEDAGEIAPLASYDNKNANNQEMIIKPEQPSRKRKIAYIIDSIKHQDELDLLRLVYRDLLYFIGVFAPLKERVAALKNEFNDKKGINYESMINKDSGEGFNFGSTIKDTFPKADFFIRVANRNFVQIDKKLERFLNLVFDIGIVIPTPNETAMYIATSSAKNSACLSRQVGAALTDEKGEVISVGWNDVPKFGGDLYKSKLNDYGVINSPDQRCMNIDSGFCFNDREKNLMVDMIFEELNEKRLLIKKNDKVFRDVYKALPDDLKDKLKDVEEITKYYLRNSKIKGLVEFSRSIHAEMHAIIMGSQSHGSRVIGGKLFVTTYPCHNCARHIIVAGIKEVYYIEPYSKSLTVKLHFDSITEDENDVKKLQILLFEGIGPNRYLELFEMKAERKIPGEGKMSDKRKAGRPKTSISGEAITHLKAVVSNHYKQHKIDK